MRSDRHVAAEIVERVRAIWSGAGVVLLTLIGYVVYGQSFDAAAVIGMGLIVAGVLQFTSSPTHTCVEQRAIVLALSS